MARASAVRRDDSGGIVVGWLTKLTVVLTLIGVVGFDSVSIGVAWFQVSNAADSAAAAAARSYGDAPDDELALSAARTAAAETDPAAVVVAPVTVDDTGHLTVMVHHPAHTMLAGRLAGHVPAIAGWIDAHAVGTASLTR
jgi:hypothetical protein